MIVIVMGVTGCGKSTVGALLAARLGLQFQDADAYHPPENRALMAANIPLGDNERWPWLRRLSELALSWEQQGGAVLACSALKQAYRDVLTARVADSRFVHLELSRVAAVRRLEARRGKHEFVSDFDRLLEGQYRDLEPPTNAITLDAELAPAELAERAAIALAG